MQQLNLFEVLQDLTPGFQLAELFEAYKSCRSTKRNTINAIAFEVDYESNLVQLWAELNNGSYQPGKSIAFIVNKPVKREIFAADFRDRVVHHLLVNKLNPLFEKTFINDSYACRVGKGTHFGIQRVDRFIRQCSVNYSQDCYVLKLDIQGFFMHIDKQRLFSKLQIFIEQYYQATDKLRVIELCYKIIFNDPTQNCIIKSKRKAWEDLPNDKSLFYSPTFSGLPIGNLTSQIFANFYMNSFDHFIKHDLGVRYYGRYVDDFVLVHQDKAYLKSLIPQIMFFLADQLKLTLHPNKIYIQHYSKGVQFLGVVIKPRRLLLAKRTKGNFYAAIEKHNAVVTTQKPNKQQQAAFLSCMNSYLGIMKHYNTHKLRKRLLFKQVSARWWNAVYLSGGIAKFVLRQRSLR